MRSEKEFPSISRENKANKQHKIQFVQKKKLKMEELKLYEYKNLI